MGFLDRLVARDHRLAETKYADRESASEKNARKRRENHRKSMVESSRQAEAWESRDRKRFRIW